MADDEEEDEEAVAEETKASILQMVQEYREPTLRSKGGGWYAPMNLPILDPTAGDPFDKALPLLLGFLDLQSQLAVRGVSKACRELLQQHIHGFVLDFYRPANDLQKALRAMGLEWHHLELHLMKLAIRIQEQCSKGSLMPPLLHRILLARCSVRALDGDNSTDLGIVDRDKFGSFFEVDDPETFWNCHREDAPKAAATDRKERWSSLVFNDKTVLVPDCEFRMSFRMSPTYMSVMMRRFNDEARYAAFVKGQEDLEKRWQNCLPLCNRFGSDCSYGALVEDGTLLDFNNYEAACDYDPLPFHNVIEMYLWVSDMVGMGELNEDQYNLEQVYAPIWLFWYVFLRQHQIEPFASAELDPMKAWTSLLPLTEQDYYDDYPSLEFLQRLLGYYNSLELVE